MDFFMFRDGRDFTFENCDDFTASFVRRYYEFEIFSWVTTSWLFAAFVHPLFQNSYLAINLCHNVPNVTPKKTRNELKNIKHTKNRAFSIGPGKLSEREIGKNMFECEHI